MPPHPHHPHHQHSHCHSSPPPCSFFSSPSPSPSPPPCCCCCSCGCSSSPPSPQPSDPMVLLQAILSNQLHSSNPSLSEHHFLQTLASHLIKPHPQPPQRHHKDPESKTQSLLLSLLHRVSALESQLPILSPPPPPPPVAAVPVPAAAAAASAASKPSLRDVAARTIQARFREFLVRRSRTLRHLKQLAAVKSHAAALRSSLSGKVRVTDSERISERAMDLLLQLDSIQSYDPMIREGKKSISRELTRILEFIDKVLPKELRNPIKEESGDRRRRSSLSSKAAKRVSFSDFDTHEPFAEDLIDLSGEMERLGRGIEGIGLNSRVLDVEHGENAELESEDELRYGVGRRFEVPNGNFGLYAPMPVQMESRES